MRRMKVFGYSLVFLAFVLPGFVYYLPSGINFLNQYGARGGYGRNEYYSSSYTYYLGSPYASKRIKQEPVMGIAACFASIVFLVFGVYFVYLNTKQERVEYLADGEALI